MEVHAHAHTARKKWTHYLWEFIMLFLAVFCGFLAENYREHQVEQHREREYIKTFVADLKSDTSQIEQGQLFFAKTFHGLDTLMTALKAPDAIENPEVINNCFGYAKDDAQFISSNRTIQQLKNSGNMRLISKDSVSDGLMNYDQIVQLTSMKYETMNNARKEVLFFLDEIIDENTTENSHVINRDMLPIASPKKLLIKDRMKLDILFNKVKRLKGYQMDYAAVLTSLKGYGDELIALLKRKYHIE